MGNTDEMLRPYFDLHQFFPALRMLFLHITIEKVTNSGAATVNVLFTVLRQAFRCLRISSMLTTKIFS